MRPHAKSALITAITWFASYVMVSAAAVHGQSDVPRPAPRSDQPQHEVPQYVVLASQGRFDEAFDVLERRLIQFPDRDQQARTVLMMRDVCAISPGAKAVYLNRLDKLATSLSGPAKGAAYAIAGEQQETLKDFQGSAKSYLRASQEYPPDSEANFRAQYSAGMALYIGHQYEKAAAIFSNLLENSRLDKASRFMVGTQAVMSLAELNRYDALIRVAEQTIPDGPKDARLVDVMEWLAEAYEKTGDPNSALRVRGEWEQLFVEVFPKRDKFQELRLQDSADRRRAIVASNRGIIEVVEGPIKGFGGPVPTLMSGPVAVQRVGPAPAMAPPALGRSFPSPLVTWSAVLIAILGIGASISRRRKKSLRVSQSKH